MKNIMIPEEVFYNLVKYFCLMMKSYMMKLKQN